MGLRGHPDMGQLANGGWGKSAGNDFLKGAERRFQCSGMM